MPPPASSRPSRKTTSTWCHDQEVEVTDSYTCVETKPYFGLIQVKDGRVYFDDGGDDAHDGSTPEKRPVGLASESLKKVD